MLYANVNHLIWRSIQYSFICYLVPVNYWFCLALRGHATCRSSSGLVPSQICTCGLLIAQNIGFQYISQARRTEQPRRACRFKAHAMTVAPCNDPSLFLPRMNRMMCLSLFLHSTPAQLFRCLAMLGLLSISHKMCHNWWNILGSEDMIFEDRDISVT